MIELLIAYLKKRADENARRASDMPQRTTSPWYGAKADAYRNAMAKTIEYLASPIDLYYQNEEWLRESFNA
jgi:hypothetical protein